MIHLIKQNNFGELKGVLINSTNYKIHSYLLDILNDKKVEINGESFSAESYQEEFLEGLSIFEALKESNIDKSQLTNFSNVLVELSFKMSDFIQLLAQATMDRGVFLSDVNSYNLNPSIRERLQDFIEHLKLIENQDKSIANLSAAKAKISTSIGNLLEKHEIGKDMLQFAQSYEKVGRNDIATKVYQGVINDFEAESIKSSSGLFPEISYVDSRPKSEIEIYEIAKNSFERLSGQNISELKKVHIDENRNEVVSKMEKTTSQTTLESENGFMSKLKRLFKKN